MKEGFEPKKISTESASIDEKVTQSEQELFESRYQGLVDILERGHFDLEFISSHPEDYPKDFLEHPKVQELAKTNLRRNFINGYYNLASKFFSIFGFSEEILGEPEMIRAAIIGLNKVISFGNTLEYEYFINLFGQYNIEQDEEVLGTMALNILERLNYRELSEAVDFINDFKTPVALFDNTELRDAIQKKVDEILLYDRASRFDGIQKLLGTGRVPPSILRTEELKYSALNRIRQLLRMDSSEERISQLIDIFDLSAAEVKAATISAIKANLTNPIIVEQATSLNLVTLEEINDTDLMKLVEEEIRSSLIYSKPKIANKLLSLYQFSKERRLIIIIEFLLKSFEIQKLGAAAAFLNETELEDRFFQSKNLRIAARKAVVNGLCDGEINHTQQIIGHFKIAKEELIELPEGEAAMKNGLIAAIYSSDITEVEKFIALIGNSDPYLSTPEVNRATRQRIAELLHRGHIESAEKIADLMNISEDIVKSAAALILNEVIDEGNINLAVKLINHYDLQYGSKYLERYFVAQGLDLSAEELETIATSDRFGINLLNKFAKFDNSAKEAVMQILKCDEQTPKEIDRRSPEYRKLVLEKLKDYKSNSHITEALTEAGVDVDTWLHYDKVDYFTLGEADDLTTAEQIKTPIERLVPSFEAITKAMKGTIEEYRKELFNTRVPIDTAELQIKKSELEKSLSAISDPNKRAGIEKGLTALTEQITNPKTILVWEKVMAEFSRLVKLAESIQAKNTELEQLEKTKITIIDDSSLKAAQDNKANTWKVKRTLIKELGQLNRRSKQIFDLLEQTLVPAIGQERASGIKQEVRSEVGEQIDHLGTDFDTIFSFINVDEETVDTDEVEDEEVQDDEAYRFNPSHAKQLQGRPMSIRVGGRSRQDLYLGNYTTCCIRIDSNHHGAESPIADYVTDLGMQNVIIYDEATGTPIASAWCWIGYHNDTKESALVIDNVEGWQKFTVNFQNQLNEQLGSYLRAYAEAIKVKNLTQGPDYNDLNPIDEDSQGEWYLKLGGSNRPDEENGTCGYYLEAEFRNHDDNDDWDNHHPDDDFDDGIHQ